MTGALASSERSPASDTLVRFLVRFSIALHKHATYPRGHPTLVTADSAVAQALEDLLNEQASLQIGVARRELLIDGAPVDSSNAVVRELAERLHRREVGAIELQRGVTADELSDALHVLSADPQQFRERLHGNGEPLPTWPHISVVAHSFRRLALADDDGSVSDADGDSSSVDRLWLLLAAATLDRADGHVGADEAEPSALASRINAYVRDQKSGRAVGAMLVRLGRHAKGAVQSERHAVESRVRSLVAGLSPQALSWLFAAQSPDERRQLLTEAVDALPVDTVVELVQAAAASTDQNISHFMLRMLKKLANQASADGDTGSQGDTALRDAARELVDNWTLEDPNPQQHTRLLEEVSRFEQSMVEGSAPLTGEGRRLLQIALETNSSGDHVLEAVELMIESRQLGELLDLLAGAPEATETVPAVRRHLISPEMLRRILLEEPIDTEGSQRLLGEVGAEGAGGLLDALAISESQGTRRLILERLAAMGPEIAAVMADRLPRAPWYVQRNLLALMARLKALPPGFSARPWAAHQEVTVRFQALSVMARHAKEREEAIHLALGDNDPRVVRFGLDAAAGGGLPRAALTRLMKLLNNPAQPMELRARGIRLLAQVQTPATREWLLERVLTKRTLFRGPRLAPKSPEMIASLVVLSRKWREHPQAAYALRVAAESGDPELVSAANGQEAAA
jgi:hypothetical protein